MAAVAVAASCGAGRAEDPVAAPRIRETAPPIYYMEDDVGRLVPVPGFRYHDFVELLRLREGLPGVPEPPAAVLENLVLRAELPAARSDAAEEPAVGHGRCRATVELTVRQSRNGWAAVPLELDGLLLTAPPRYAGAGRMLLSAATGATAPDRDDADRGANAPAGYRLWVTGTLGRGDPDVRHSIVLEGDIGVDDSPGGQAIAVHLPRATASLVEVATSRIAPQVSVSPASLPPRVEPRDGGAGSVVSLVGLAGAARIRISGPRDATDDSAAAGQRRAAVPQVMVESVVRIDGRLAVTAATLQLDDLPPDLRTIRITLPPRAAVRSVSSPAELVAVEGTAAAAEAVVRIAASGEGRGTVQLECERPVDPTGSEAFEPLGFAVKDVPPWRQRGRTSLVVDGDWQLDWNDTAAYRRVDPPPAARRIGFVAAFAYDSQPARLPLRVRPRGSRVVVEPEYRYDVSASRIAFDARLRVSVRGAPVSRISLDLDDWEVDDVGPASVVDAAAVSAERGRLVIPFVQPLSGAAVIEIRGGRTLAGDAARVGWKIPTPQADLVGPATILVASQSDIELLPDAAGVQGLVRQLTPNVARGDGDRVSLAYRLDGTEGRFEATRRFLPRRVDATVVAQADIDESDMIVRETIRFDVAHVPLEFVALSVPAEVVRAGTLEVRQNGLLLNPEEETARAADEGDAPPDAEPTVSRHVPVRAMLATPLLGTGEVTVYYELPTPAVPPESTTAEDLPLVLPAGTRIDRMSLTLAAAETLSIDVRGDAWKLDVGSLGSVASRSWTTGRVQEAAPLAIAARKRSPLGDTIVEAAWFQTRVFGERREDVYRYALQGAADRVTLRLPTAPAEAAGSGGGAVEVRLDGQTLPVAAGVDGGMILELPQSPGRGARLLEVIASRRRDRMPGMPEAIDLSPPLFPAGTVQRRFYWEIVAEPDQHPLGQPRSWTREQRWEWGSFGLARVSVVSRAALDAWLSASLAAPGGTPRFAFPAEDRAPAPPRVEADLSGAGPRAVFSGAGPPAPGRLWLVPTWLLVLALSGPVLLVGLLAVYRPRLRSTPVVLAAAAVASLAAAAAPEVAPLFLQAALPGLALSGLAGVLKAAYGRRTHVPPAHVPPLPRVSASSLTQVAAPPSLIIAASTGSAREDAAVGREPS